MNFIEKTEFTANLQQMMIDFENFILENPWPETTYTVNSKKYAANQLGLTHRKNADCPIGDASGNLIDQVTKKFIASEKDFTEWNNIGSYTRNTIENLSQYVNSKFGRIRYMRLMPKTGLSVHADFECRYHYVFQTNKYAYFGESIDNEELAAKCYHIPADGYFYKVDTTRDHFVYNGGWEPRIHLVICAA